MKVYLDNCMFNRPFDDQGQIRIKLEAEAKLYIQQQIREGHLQLVWSYMLEFENAQNPFTDRRHAILQWRDLANLDVEESPQLLETAKMMLAKGIRVKDALHVACAISAGADYFLSTDDKLLKKLQTVNGITCLNPLDFVKEPS
ncbi:type II toxin-antitoxin system VapC family toxin [Thiothrix nivea]|uniref:Uncharacterized protein n=1 Tax=Thiothrix nivea (strain ATCC 35100 / DSM 5205 / JP2) TaxID=870187 RepID=A0A656HKJ3_THINJ|nr:PIN domain-containing protein [Thiothrix nivea]EIJ36752.1 hypothetical protein Thini_4270 [Thiothrix nivea DSM 5205]